MRDKKWRRYNTFKIVISLIKLRLDEKCCDFCVSYVINFLHLQPLKSARRKNKLHDVHNMWPSHENKFQPVKLKNFFCENCCPWGNKILHPEWTHLHLFLKAFDQLSRTTNNPLQMLLNLIIKQNYISGVGEVKSPLSLTIKKHSCTKNSVRKFLELENIMWCNSKLFIVNWFWYWSFADISTGLWGNFLPSSFFMNEHFRQVGGSKLKSKTSKHSRYRL